MHELASGGLLVVDVPEFVRFLLEEAPRGIGAMSWTADLLQAIFFAISSLALVIGGAVAFSRVRPGWKVTVPSGCRVRRTADGTYAYYVEYQIVNLSVLPQPQLRAFARLLFPTDYQWGHGFSGASLAEMETYYGPGSTMPPIAAGDTAHYTGLAISGELHDIVWLSMSIRSETRRWLGTTNHTYSTPVPVAVEDIFLYGKNVEAMQGELQSGETA